MVNGRMRLLEEHTVMVITAAIFRHDVTQNQVCGRVHEQTWKAKPISALGMIAVVDMACTCYGSLSHG
jgi:hypothetical protein